jgi:hypothetical protein
MRLRIAVAAVIPRSSVNRLMAFIMTIIESILGFGPDRFLSF